MRAHCWSLDSRQWHQCIFVNLNFLHLWLNISEHFRSWLVKACLSPKAKARLFFTSSLRAALETNILFKKLVRLTAVPLLICHFSSYFSTDSLIRWSDANCHSLIQVANISFQTPDEWKISEDVSPLSPNLSWCDAKSSSQYPQAKMVFPWGSRKHVLEDRKSLLIADRKHMRALFVWSCRRDCYDEDAHRLLKETSIRIRIVVVSCCRMNMALENWRYLHPLLARPLSFLKHEVRLRLHDHDRIVYSLWPRTHIRYGYW
jgi:hypothetical protein